jgi:hypothetical protein
MAKDAQDGSTMRLGRYLIDGANNVTTWSDFISVPADKVADRMVSGDFTNDGIDDAWCGYAGFTAVHPSVDNCHQVIHTPLLPSSEGGLTQLDADGKGDQLAAISVQARRFLLEPADAPWHEVVRALSEALGEDETYELLRAIRIRYRTSSSA